MPKNYLQMSLGTIWTGLDSDSVWTPTLWVGSDLKDRIITDKVLRLIDLDLVEVIEPKIDEICNILNSFLVKHNSKAGAQFITGKADKNDANAIDPSSWGKNSKISR